MPEVVIREHEPADAEALLGLHNRAFAGQPKRSLRHWLWLTDASPTGRAKFMVAARPDGSIAGVFGGAVRRMVLAGRPCEAFHNLDVATDPSLRRGLGGAGLLIELGTRHAAFYGGEVKLVWGFPQPALVRIALRHLRYEILRDVVFLARYPEPAIDPVPDITIEVVARWTDEVDGLWERCRDEIGTATVRDSRYLNWRYADHPAYRHSLLTARDAQSNELRGIAVLRDGGWDPAVASLLDWLVPCDDRDAEAALIAHAIRATHALGRRCLVCWFPVPSIQFHRLQVDHGFFAVATPYQEVFRSFANGVDRRWLGDRWYQTMGDMDFF